MVGENTIEPILDGAADMVIGSRATGRRERGALSVQQRVGNAIASSALRALYDVRYTDLGPFRAVRWDTLKALKMQDRNYGWTVEIWSPQRKFSTWRRLWVRN